MDLQRALRLLLAGTLLAAWQAALVHPIEHVDAGGEFVHIADGHGSDGSGRKSGPDAQCDAIAAVAACVGGFAKSLVVVFQDDETLLFWRTEAPRSAPAPAYRSQAPPSLL